MRQNMTIAILMSVLGMGQSFANCNDERLADCGSFKILKRSCSDIDETRKISVETEAYFADYRSFPSGQKKLIATTLSGGKLYHGFVNSQRDVYFMIDSEIGAGGTPEKVYSGWQFSFGKMGAPKKCSLIINR